ncbi:MAG: hypothetical protein WA366_05405 [Pseudolabrys sp.]|jgi:hypothetical protein
MVVDPRQLPPQDGDPVRIAYVGDRIAELEAGPSEKCKRYLGFAHTGPIQFSGHREDSSAIVSLQCDGETQNRKQPISHFVGQFFRFSHRS